MPKAPGPIELLDMIVDHVVRPPYRREGLKVMDANSKTVAEFETSTELQSWLVMAALTCALACAVLSEYRTQGPVNPNLN